ncbi:CCAR1 isoform 14, partial [Pan troglodytes]
TAIRCCKALTGIDLSVCTQWHRNTGTNAHHTLHNKHTWRNITGNSDW